MKQRHKKDAMKQRHKKVIEEAKPLATRRKVEIAPEDKYKVKTLFPDKVAQAD